MGMPGLLQRFIISLLKFSSPALKINLTPGHLIFTPSCYSSLVFYSKKIVAFYRTAIAKYTISNIDLIKMERAIPLLFPVYDTGISEATYYKGGVITGMLLMYANRYYSFLL